MPPPMPNPSKRVTANPVRPARHRPGKAVPEENTSDEDDEEELEEVPKAVIKSTPRSQARKPQAQTQEDSEEDDDDEEGFVTEDEDELPAVPAAPTGTQSGKRKLTSTTQPDPSNRVAQPLLGINQRQEADSSDGEAATGSSGSSEEDDSDDDEEDDESSSEEEPQRQFQRPTFIRKVDRQKPAWGNANGQGSRLDNHDEEEGSNIINATTHQEVEEQTRRLAQAELYIKDKLEKDAIARAQGKKAWDDDEEISAELQVDDTDGLDPAAEKAAWKLRELHRLKRDREAIEVREKEIEEIERRRNLTAEEREAEDREYIARQQEEKEAGRGKANFLAKYHHKGAFFQDDEMAETLKKRNVMGAKFQDEVSDKSVLPEYMRVRDMTKLGKKGRTRYQDLKNEDTGRFGDAVKRWKGSGYENRVGEGQGGFDTRGVDERFLPDDERGRRGDGMARGPTGANASVVGVRKETRRFRSQSRSVSRSRSRSRSPPRRGKDDGDKYERGDRYRSRRRSYSRSRSRSRSNTPPVRRKRSPSPRLRSFTDRDKRRRVDAD